VEVSVLSLTYFAKLIKLIE